MAATAGTAVANLDQSEAADKGHTHEKAKRGNEYHATASGAQTDPRYVNVIEL